MAANEQPCFEDLPQQRPLREQEDIRIFDKEGFLCRITLDADFKLTPKELMRLFSNPDNSGVFRDIYAVPYREVVEDDGEGRQKVVVEQVSGFKFLVVPITFSTHLNVEKNLSKGTFRSSCLEQNTVSVVRYWLGKKGIMKKFVGEWHLYPIYSPEDDNSIIGCRALLEQDLLPSFVPIFCAGMMKNVSKRAIQRIVEDINIFSDRYHSGESFEELLKPKKERQGTTDISENWEAAIAGPTGQAAQ